MDLKFTAPNYKSWLLMWMFLTTLKQIFPRNIHVNRILYSIIYTGIIGGAVGFYQSSGTSCTAVSLFPCHGQLVCGCWPPHFIISAHLRPLRQTVKCEKRLYLFELSVAVLVLLFWCVFLYLVYVSIFLWLPTGVIQMNRNIEILSASTICPRSFPQM